jgi:hypothetical protein
LGLHKRGLAPSPHWAGKKSPKGSKKEHPSYFWRWPHYHTFGTYTGPQFGILVLDIDDPAKFRKLIEKFGLLECKTLDGCLVSYHRADSPEAVRAGTAKGKLIFQFAADENHPLARINKAALKSALGVEIFYGHGDPSVLGAHPDGPGQEYLLSDGPVGPPPDWLLEDLVERASQKVRAPKAKTPGGNGATSNPAAVAKYGAAALDGEVAKVAAAPEGERNCTVWKASCALGSLVGAGVLDREEAEERLQKATTLPPEEAVDVIRRGLDRGAEAPRDLAHVGGNGDGFERPMIEITVEEHDVNDQAIAALAADPDLYQRGNTLVRTLREGPRPDDMETGRDPGGLTIAPIHAATLRERLTKYAFWAKKAKGPDGEEVYWPAHPPDWSVPAVLNRGSWPGIRFLEGVTETPILRADGTVLETPGYDRRSGILYVPEIEFPKIPTYPTWEDAKQAVAQLYDLVAEFPFKVNEQGSQGDHKAAWLAALLTPFVRECLVGPAPLFLFDANTAGSGKTLLCDIISIVGTGRCVGRTTYPSSEEEMDKMTLAMAMDGTKLILFDNTATGNPIGGAALDAALTATTRSGRVLGASRFVKDIPFSPTFLCTGNNAGLKGDTLRRVITSRLESSEERPEEREGFAIPNLLEYVREHRGKLAMAALTILRAYIVAGRPIPAPKPGYEPQWTKPTPMGGFEAWANLVRRAVHWVTGHDPLATKAEAKSADKMAVLKPVLIAGWAALCQSEGKDSLSTAQAIKVLENHPGDHELLRTTLTETTKDGKLPSPNSLGNLLGKVRGQPVEGRYLERVKSGVGQWFVKTVPHPAKTAPTAPLDAPAAEEGEDPSPF